MPFLKYNANPLDRRGNDCTIRAISFNDEVIAQKTHIKRKTPLEQWGLLLFGGDCWNS